MASALLRTSVRGGRTVGRFVSAARPGGDALAARPVSLRRYPLRRLSNSTPGDQLPEGPSADEKVDQMLKLVEELDQLMERDVAELVERYKAYQTADHSSFERFLTRCGISKSKYRDDFVWRCQYSAMFGLSVGVGCVLADMI